MNTALWIMQGVLGLAFFAAGAMKLTSSKEALVKKGQPWAADFSAGSVKLIGLAEVLGAIGLVVPRATGIAALLTPIAAGCLVLLMVGGAVVHVRRKENPVPPIALGVLGALVAIGRGGWS
jgi:uncharacterized membrane protein